MTVAEKLPSSESKYLERKRERQYEIIERRHEIALIALEFEKIMTAQTSHRLLKRGINLLPEALQQPFEEAVDTYRKIEKEAKENEANIENKLLPEGSQDAETELAEAVFRAMCEREPQGKIEFKREGPFFVMICSDPRAMYDLDLYSNRQMSYEEWLKKGWGGLFWSSIDLIFDDEKISIPFMAVLDDEDLENHLAHERQHFINNKILKSFEYLVDEPDFAEPVKDEVLSYLRNREKDILMTLKPNGNYSYLYSQMSQEQINEIHQALISIDHFVRAPKIIPLFSNREFRSILIYQLAGIPLADFPKYLEAMEDFYDDRGELIQQVFAARKNSSLEEANQVVDGICADDVSKKMKNLENMDTFCAEIDQAYFDFARLCTSDLELSDLKKRQRAALKAIETTSRRIDRGMDGLLTKDRLMPVTSPSELVFYDQYHRQTEEKCDFGAELQIDILNYLQSLSLEQRQLHLMKKNTGETSNQVFKEISQIISAQTDGMHWMSYQTLTDCCIIKVTCDVPAQFKKSGVYQIAMSFKVPYLAKKNSLPQNMERPIIQRTEVEKVSGTEMYDQKYEKKRPEPRAVVKYFVDNFVGKYDHCLDLGCGEGRHSRYIAQKGIEVVGVDLSAVGLDKANEDLEDFEHAQFVRADMHHLPFADQSFAALIANRVIEYNDDEGIEETFGEIERVLKPGAKIFFTVRSVSQPAKKSEKLITENETGGRTYLTMRGKEKGAYNHYFTQAELKKLCEKHHLKLIGIREETKTNSQEEEKGEWQLILEKIND